LVWCVDAVCGVIDWDIVGMLLGSTMFSGSVRVKVVFGWGWG
jgi:hypothetical protein